MGGVPRERDAALGPERQLVDLVEREADEVACRVEHLEQRRVPAGEPGSHRGKQGLLVTGVVVEVWVGNGDDQVEEGALLERVEDGVGEGPHPAAGDAGGGEKMPEGWGGELRAGEERAVGVFACWDGLCRRVHDGADGGVDSCVVSVRVVAMCRAGGSYRRSQLRHRPGRHVRFEA